MVGMEAYQGYNVLQLKSELPCAILLWCWVDSFGLLVTSTSSPGYHSATVLSSGPLASTFILLPPWPVEKYSLRPSPQRYFLCMFFLCAFCPRTPRHWRACIRTVSLWIWNQLHFSIHIPPAPRLTLIPWTEFFCSWWVFSLSSFPVHLSSGLRAIHLTGMCLAWSSLLPALQGFP